MRLVKTFVLRLFVDSNAPDRTCGSVRLLDEPETYPFKDVGDLENILHRSVIRVLKPRATRPPKSRARS